MTGRSAGRVDEMMSSTTAVTRSCPKLVSSLMREPPEQGPRDMSNELKTTEFTWETTTQVRVRCLSNGAAINVLSDAQGLPIQARTELNVADGRWH